jgi:glycosyltransferase involved in cell wall biosynthesis
VVAYALDGAPEVVVPGATGWCVPPGDTAALAAAIRAVAADPGRARAMAAEGGRRASARFRAEAMVDALAGLYRARHFD